MADEWAGWERGGCFTYGSDIPWLARICRHNTPEFLCRIYWLLPRLSSSVPGSMGVQVRDDAAGDLNGIGLVCRQAKGIG